MAHRHTRVFDILRCHDTVAIKVRLRAIKRVSGIIYKRLWLYRQNIFVLLLDTTHVHSISSKREAHLVWFTGLLK